MKKFLALVMAGAAILGVSSVVYANVCAFDPVPAATLLFPFVAFDYSAGAAGTTTIFSITNVSSEATIAHVAIWSDFSVGILDYNILLTGYDVQRTNIRDILVGGQLPVTVNGAHTSGREGVADDGPVSSVNELNADWISMLMDQPQATNALGTRCATSDPAYPGQYQTPIPGGVLALFQDWLQSSQTQTRYHADDCVPAYTGGYVPELPNGDVPWFQARDDQSATWMYITVDVAEACNKLFPDAQGYFHTDPAFDGLVREDNVLIGDVQWVDAQQRFSESDLAVHIEADWYLADVATEVADPFGTGYPVSFYHRYGRNLHDQSDYREPLPTAWAFRYQGAGNPAIDTWVRAWKGGTVERYIYDLEFTPVNESPSTFVASNCWAYTYYSWDEDENVITSATNPWSQPGGEAVVLNLLPLETQEVEIDQFNTVAEFGWMLFVWPNSNTDVPLGPGAFPDYYQTWMGVKYAAFGDYSAAMSGVVMANYNCFSDQVLPNLGIDYPYIDATTGQYTRSPCTVANDCWPIVQ